MTAARFRQPLRALCAILWVLAGFLSADTIPPQPQNPGEHSSVACKDGSVRDDELARAIADNLPRDADGNPQVKDVKVFVQSCYGGGILDDIGRLLSPPNVPSPGVRWVGGSAASADEYSWGPDNKWITDNGSGMGDYWSNTLIGEISGNVQEDVDAAGAQDPAGMFGAVNIEHGVMEHPQTASGNGGDGVSWGIGDATTEHSVVAFSGSDEPRHANDVQNFAQTCQNMWGGRANVNSVTGGTRQQLLDMVANAARYCHSDKQLVVYISGHGDTEFDPTELPIIMGGPGGQPIIWDPPPIGWWRNWSGVLPLHTGWLAGLAMMDYQGLEPDPRLRILIGAPDPLYGPEWELLLNGSPILLPPLVEPGLEYLLPVDWHAIREGDNLLTLSFVMTGQSLDQPPGQSLTFLKLELLSGPITEATAAEIIPEPLTLLSLAGGLAVLGGYARRRRASGPGARQGTRSHSLVQ